MSSPLRLRTRKTRIVCISDTHCQTPKLPKGDVLIHAGDLTNQGSHSELKRTVEWLEKADFEAKIVVAGNHDLTLDAAFFEEYGSLWRWPQNQDVAECRRLLTESKSITYLENEAATIHLDAKDGPKTCFKVFGSPNTPKVHNWAFQYGPGEASQQWDVIPTDTDIVVTHTPPKGHCDTATKDDRSGCGALLHALHRVQPMLAVCGHIHEARGVERVRWNMSFAENGCLVDSSEIWTDPGAGSNKQSMINLTAKGGHGLANGSSLTRQGPKFSNSRRGGESEATGGVVEPSKADSTLSIGGFSKNEAMGRAVFGGACEHGQRSMAGDVGPKRDSDVEALEGRETVVINAALLGPRLSGTAPKVMYKPIVVDVDLPVWSVGADAE